MRKFVSLIHILLALVCLALTLHMLTTTRDLGWGALLILFVAPGIAVFALAAWFHAKSIKPAIVVMVILWMIPAVVIPDVRAFCLFMTVLNLAPLVSISGWRFLQNIPLRVGEGLFTTVRKTPRWVPLALCVALLILAGGYVWDYTAGFTRSSLSNAELAEHSGLMQGKTFREQEISGLVLSDTTIANATFDRVRFTNCRFTNVIFDGCTFINGASVESFFDKVTFKDCAFKHYTSIFFLWEKMHPPSMYRTRENALAWDYELHLRGDVLFKHCTGTQEQPNLHAAEANVTIEDSTFTDANFGELSKSLHARNSTLSGVFIAEGNVYIEGCDIIGYLKSYKGDLVMKDSTAFVRLSIEKGTGFLVNNTYRESMGQKQGVFKLDIQEGLEVVGSSGKLYILGSKGEPVWLEVQDPTYPEKQQPKIFMEKITLKSLSIVDSPWVKSALFIRDLGPGVALNGANIQAWTEPAPPVPQPEDMLPVW